MERISAACAMEWSIDLEKGLRSKVTGGPLEAIVQIGQRLEQWNREPEPTLPVYKMFGLVPGEDRLFANAILLRLADAFRLGDHNVRHSVVKVFLSLRSRNKNKYNGGKNYGILSKHRVHNQLQLLSRVKIVFDSGDVESRALTLIIFGCWADFAKDSAEIRYIILSSLVSSHVVEVKASFYAAACFCEQSDDFASAVLEILVNMVSSSQTTSAVDLLCSFLTQETTVHVKATVIRCLHFIFIRSVCHFPVSAYIIKTLFSMLDDPEVPSDLQCQALQIFHKIALYSLANGKDMLELDKLLTIIENASNSPITSKRLLAIRVLVDVSGKLRKIGSDGVDSPPLLSQIIALVIDQVASFVKPMLDLCYSNSEVEKECQSLFSLLLLLVEEHPDLVVLALDKIHLFIEYLVNMHDGVMSASKASLSVNEIVDLKGKMSMSIMSKLAIYVYRFVASCLEHLKETGSITAEVVHKVKLLVEHVHQCSLIDCYIHMIYSFLLYSCNSGDFVGNENKETNNRNENLVITLDDCLIEHETHALECAEKILAGMDYWNAYKAGKYAAQQGAWFTASFIFERLMTKVQSDSCCCWLKSLAQFSHSEKKIQLLLLPKQGSSFDNWLETKKVSTIHFKDGPVEIALDAAGNINLPKCYEKLIEAYSSLCSSLEALETIVKPGQAFCFQRWFLALRVKVLAAVVDIVKLLGTVPFNQDKITYNEQVMRIILIEYPQLFQQISRVSFQLKRLAQEFDLMATSFIGMDGKSSKIISALALSCSILAFITGFSLYFPQIPVYESVTTCSLEGLKGFSHSALIQDLIGRLWHIDHETSANLWVLLKASGQPKSCCHLQSRNQIWNSGCGVKNVLTVCRYAVSQIVHLQNEANKGHNEEDQSQLTKDGWQLLLDVVMKWMHIPFRTPKYFFQARHCVGSELFASSTDTRSPDGISILPGFHLSLNLCLQLTNVPPDISIQLTKLYCILYCKASFTAPKPIEENKQRMQSSYHSWEIEDMVDLNKNLFQHVTEDGETTNTKRRRVDNCDGGVVKAFVCFEPNERGQGFSTCLLDVSGFPAGSYKIKWHSCCVDGQGSYWSLLPLNAAPVFTLLDPLDATVTTK